MTGEEKAALKTLLGEQPPKKKMHASKKLAYIGVIFPMAIVLYTITWNAILLLLGMAAMPEETVATITTFGGITATGSTVFYNALAGWRDHSLNKNRIHIHEDTGHKHIMAEPGVIPAGEEEIPE